MTRSRRRSRSRRHSGHRSRSHSPRDNQSSANNSQDNNTNKQTQFIPIPIPYYQPQPSAQPATATVPQSSAAPAANPTSNVTQPMSYVLQQPKPQYLEELVQSTVRKPFEPVSHRSIDRSVGLGETCQCSHLQSRSTVDASLQSNAACLYHCVSSE